MSNKSINTTPPLGVSVPYRGNRREQGRGLYRINEIFYSLQGEGRWAGRAAIFIRFSGCNLRCPFCDTDFTAYKEMTIEEILKEIETLITKSVTTPPPFLTGGGTGGGSGSLLVLTGGEPSLQVDEELISALHAKGYFIAMETNGTHTYPEGIDWVTLSPKDQFVNGNSQVVIKKANELKLVYDMEHEPYDYPEVEVQYRYLQPCDTGFPDFNKPILVSCIEYIKSHPQWQLSLQQHKILNIR